MNKIKLTRKQIGMTEEELSYRTGIPLMTIRYYEMLDNLDSISNPRITKLERVLKVKLREE